MNGNSIVRSDSIIMQSRAKARFYHWIGDTDNALKYANEVIEAKSSV